jgi:hypothetical protein
MTELSGIAEGDICKVEDRGVWYVRGNGRWELLPGVKQWSVPLKANLPTDTDIVKEGDFSYTTGATKRGYYWINGAWQCTTHFEAGT